MRRVVGTLCWLSGGVVFLLGTVWIGHYLATLDTDDPLYSVSVSLALLYWGVIAMLALGLIAAGLLVSRGNRTTRTVSLALLGLACLVGGFFLPSVGVETAAFVFLPAASLCFYLVWRQVESVWCRRPALAGSLIALGQAARWLIPFPFSLAVVVVVVVLLLSLRWVEALLGRTGTAATGTP